MVTHRINNPADRGRRNKYYDTSTRRIALIALITTRDVTVYQPARTATPDRAKLNNNKAKKKGIKRAEGRRTVRTIDGISRNADTVVIPGPGHMTPGPLVAGTC